MKIKTILITFTTLVALLGVFLYVRETFFLEKENFETFAKIVRQENLEQDSEDVYSEIVRLYELKAYKSVIGTGNEFLAKFPLDDFAPNIYLKIAESYYELLEFQKAQRAYDNIIVKFPKTKMAIYAQEKKDLMENMTSMNSNSKLSSELDLFESVRASYKKGDFDSSIGYSKIFLKKYPKSDLRSNAQYWIGKSFYAKQEFKVAKKEFEKILIDYPKSVMISLANAEIAKCSQKISRKSPIDVEKKEYNANYKNYQNKKYNLAISEFKKYIEKYPNSRYISNSYYWIGQCYYSLANYKQGVYYNTIENFDKAKTNFNIVLERFPLSNKAPDARVKLEKIQMITFYVKAREKFVAQDYEQAIKSFEIYLLKYPKTFLTVNSIFWLGECYYYQKDYNSALSEYEKVVDNYDREHHKVKDAKRRIKEINSLKMEAAKVSVVPILEIAPPDPVEPIIDTPAPVEPSPIIEAPVTQREVSQESKKYYQINSLYLKQDYIPLEVLADDFIEGYPNSKYIDRVRFMLAESFFNQDRYYDASDIYKKLLDENSLPQRKVIIQKKYDECMKILNVDRANLLEEKNTEGGFVDIAKEGIYKYENGDNESALDEFKKLRGKFTDDKNKSLLGYWLAKTYYKKNDFERVKIYLASVNMDHLSTRERESHLYMSAIASYQLGNYKEVQAVCDNYFKEYKKNMSDYYYKSLEEIKKSSLEKR